MKLGLYYLLGLFSNSFQDFEIKILKNRKNLRVSEAATRISWL